MDAATRYVAPRTCTVVADGEPHGNAAKQAPLNIYADTPAYVLIAEPGAGKTTAFESEARNQDAAHLTVRDFLTLNRPEWQGKTLFLDGLDESRADGRDGRAPLDRIRTKLDRLECPRFRISCRWSYWLAANDRESLRNVSPNRQVTVVRLDPLSKKGVKDILSRNHGVDDPDGFIAAARERGVERLLSNPQNLELLATTVAKGSWPDSRRATFERACEILVLEPNGEHRIARPTAMQGRALLDTAARLCAVQLIAGHSGYTLPDRAVPDSNNPSLPEVKCDSQDLANQVLGTRLFVGVSEGKLAPAHRQIAEFLAARYVAALLERGLPLNRVLALITGFDGELMPQFGNFVSWLAVHSKRSRRTLGRLDPSGLIYVADPEVYSPEEKRELVLNLRREWRRNPSCSRSQGRVTGIGRIVSPELESTFREILSDRERGLEQQSYVMDVLQMLADGEPLTALANLLGAIVRDSTWFHGVRCWALDVLIAYENRGCLDSAALEAMVHGIRDGSIDDPDDELLGILLKALYPKVLSMRKVKEYLRAPKLKDRMGAYSKFWTDHVRRESTSEQLAELMDSMAESIERRRTFLVGEVASLTGMGQIPVDVLDEILPPFRSELNVPTHRLFDWLGVISDPGLRVPDWKLASLKSRLEWNEGALKPLVAHAVENSVTSVDDYRNPVDRTLLGARPLRYAPWCIEQALAADNRATASFYVRELIDCFTNGRRADRLTVDDARNGLADNETLLRQFDDWLETRASPQRRSTPNSEQSRENAQHEVAGPQRATGEGAARTIPRLTAEALHRAAETYFGLRAQCAGRTPRDRLAELTGGHAERADLILAQLEETVWSRDLPDRDEVIRLFDQQKVHLRVLPFAAGLHSLEQAKRFSIGKLKEPAVRLAVTMLYTLPRPCFDPDRGERAGMPRPGWFQSLLKGNPSLVANVLYKSAMLKLETGLQPAIELRELADRQDHREVGSLVSMRLLREFPRPLTDAAKMSFCWSLHAALASADWSDVLRIISERFRQTELSVAERTILTVAGYLISPDDYREALRSLADREEQTWLVEFVSVTRFKSELASRLAPNDLQPLVALAGSANRVCGLTMKAYWWISGLVMTLAEHPDNAADECLEELSCLPDAEFCSDAIAAATERRTMKRREKDYHHCTIADVVETLDNRRPANVGDLAALVSDELLVLSTRVRQGPPSDWRQYWNVDGANRPVNPKPENACRDALLSDLLLRLEARGIDVQAEGTYADDTRSDIRVNFAGFNVPVEIKRSCHPALWTAIREQLIVKYTRDPATKGFGIYLVFWFGDHGACSPTPLDGWVPESGDDVRRKLEQSLADREQNFVSICVVDVAVSPGKTAGGKAKRSTK